MVGSIVAGLVAALVATGPAVACPGVDRLPCGTVLTADTTLRADVTCTPEQQAAGLAALVVMAGPVVLHLGGHTVHGTIPPSATARPVGSPDGTSGRWLSPAYG